MLKDQQAEVTDLLLWNKRMSKIIGIWPKGSNDGCCAFGIIYISIHVTMEWIDFVDSIGNFGLIVDNLSESITFTIVLIKLIVFRKNRILSIMIDAMNEDFSNYKHKSLEEKKSYAAYNSLAKTFYQISIPLVSSSAVFYYMRPIAEYLFTGNRNETTPFPLAYHVHFFFKITEIYSYVLAYLYGGLALHLVVIGWVATDGLLITLTLHICGELSNLADNIVNLNNRTKDCRYLTIQSIVKRHLRLIWMANNIDRAFTITLLAQLLGSAVLIALNGYNVIVNSGETQKTGLITFILYESSLLVILYFYCFIGECLIQEVVKKSVAYLSVLRTLV